MSPNSIWETLSRRLSRFGDHGPIRRALERVGLVKRDPDLLTPKEWAEAIRILNGPSTVPQWLRDAVKSERSKQITDVWQAADRAERGGK